MGRQDKLFAQFKPNIIVIASFIFFVCVGICVLIFAAIRMEDSDTDFVIGALIGLLGSGITGLAGLGTTLVSDNQNAPANNPVQSKEEQQTPRTG